MSSDIALSHQPDKCDRTSPSTQMRSHNSQNLINAIALHPLNNKCVDVQRLVVRHRTFPSTQMRSHFPINPNAIALLQHHKCVAWLFIIRANFFSQIGTGSEVFF
ncbi:hypothetical protein [Nostoc sp.]|uniref:hypothetical protein n=1 Tax=Nostoc sp. TaxID=1180 RepID=UPI002FF1FD17